MDAMSTCGHGRCAPWPTCQFTRGDLAMEKFAESMTWLGLSPNGQRRAEKALADIRNGAMRWTPRPENGEESDE